MRRFLPGYIVAYTRAVVFKLLEKKERVYRDKSKEDGDGSKS